MRFAAEWVPLVARVTHGSRTAPMPPHARMRRTADQGDARLGRTAALMAQALKGTAIDWCFSRDDARITLKRLYPSTQA